jgi:hypothetical protein
MTLVILADLLAVAPSMAQSIEERFLQRCLDSEPAHLRASPPEGWFHSLCLEEARQRARDFREGGRDQRLALLGAGCREWFDANSWRFSPRVTGDERAWRTMTERRCVAEAEDELPQFVSSIGTAGHAEPIGEPEIAGSILSWHR